MTSRVYHFRYLSGYQQVLHSHGQQCLSCAEKRPDFKLIRKRFLQKCVCFRGSALDPAGGLTAPPDPQLEKVGLHTNPSHRCQPSRIRRDSPAFSSDVSRSREISRCPAFFENGIIIFSVDPILHVCLATQQSDELRIKIGKDRFRIRTPTGH